MFRPSLAIFRAVLNKEKSDGQLCDRCAVVMWKYTCRVKHALKCLKHRNVSRASLVSCYSAHLIRSTHTHIHTYTYTHIHTHTHTHTHTYTHIHTHTHTYTHLCQKQSSCCSGLSPCRQWLFMSWSVQGHRRAPELETTPSPFSGTRVYMNGVTSDNRCADTFCDREVRILWSKARYIHCI